MISLDISHRLRVGFPTVCSFQGTLRYRACGRSVLLQWQSELLGWTKDLSHPRHRHCRHWKAPVRYKWSQSRRFLHQRPSPSPSPVHTTHNVTFRSPFRSREYSLRGGYHPRRDPRQDLLHPRSPSRREMAHWERSHAGQHADDDRYGRRAFGVVYAHAVVCSGDRHWVYARHDRSGCAVQK